MKIFKLRYDVDNYQTFHLENQILTKKEKKSFSRAKELSLVTENFKFITAGDKNIQVGDLKWCWDFVATIFSSKAVQVFKSYEGIKGQFFNFDNDFILFNNLEVIDALDLSKSIFDYIEDIIFSVKKYSFKHRHFPLLFQIKLPSGIVEMDYFVTEEFIKIVEENDLKGFLFEEVWDSEKE